MKEGDIAQFDYSQPDQGKMRRIGRIISVRDTQTNPVKYRKHRKNDEGFNRSRFLYTVQHPDGKIRSYYQHAVHPIPNSVRDKFNFGIQHLFSFLRGIIRK